MKKILTIAVVVLFFSGILAAEGRAMLLPQEDLSGGSGGSGSSSVLSTPPIIEGIRSYEFKKQTAQGVYEFVTISAKDLDGDNLTLTVNVSGFGTSGATVLTPVNSPGYVSVQVVLNTYWLAANTTYTIAVSASDGNAQNIQTAEIPVKITSSPTVNAGIKLNDTLTKYIQVSEGQHQEHSIVLEGLGSSEQGYILVAGLYLPYINFTNDGTTYAPYGRLIIDAPLGSAGSKFELTVRGAETVPIGSTHFAETKVIVEFVP